MTQQDDIEIELPDGRILQAFVETTWVYERNPGDKETAHYHGEDDGYHVEDWQFVGDVTIDGTISDIPVSKEDYAVIEKAVERLEPNL